ncbi:MAG TPA: histidine kinase [Ignavibacteria bacterium]|nr:histidine kinase [Ignavibacteria bacterium]
MENRTILKFHIIFWIVVISISLLETFTIVENILFLSQLSGTLSVLLYNSISFYLFYLVISQKYFNKKNLALLFLIWLVYITVASFLVTFLSYYPFVYFYPSSIPLKITQHRWVTSYVYGVAATGTVFSVLGALAKVAKIWYSSKIKQMETEKQNLSNELAMLRAQVNPHFLFNTLNNIKSLIKSLPSKAVYSIEKLNGIMNYMLFESSLEKVPLTNEINYIKNYLELEKIRYSDPDFISFSITGDYSGVSVPPLIFMPFIENAFKHGNKLTPSPGVVIKIDIDQKNICFSVKNLTKENTEERSRNSGFGLPNIRRRLDLLFEKNYTLEITNRNREFNVKLNFLLQ